MFILALTIRNIHISVFCNLSKAYDTLDHSILINKLNKYETPGTAPKLIQSYFNDRSMYVKNGNACSDNIIIPYCFTTIII